MIISLTGPMASGKDTMADYVVETYGFVKIGMADPMKRVAKEVYEFSDEQLWGPSQERNREDMRYPRPDGTYLSARVALQLLGNEWSRVCYPLTWPEYLKRVITKVQAGFFYDEKRGAYEVLGKKSDYQGVVVPNSRFRNEIEFLQRMGAMAVRLKRSSLNQAAALATGIKHHASEAEQMTIPDSLFDYVIDVPEGIEEFKKAIDRCMKELRVK